MGYKIRSLFLKCPFYFNGGHPLLRIVNLYINPWDLCFGLTYMQLRRVESCVPWDWFLPLCPFCGTRVVSRYSEITFLYLLGPAGKILSDSRARLFGGFFLVKLLFWKAPHPDLHKTVDYIIIPFLWLRETNVSCFWCLYNQTFIELFC